MTRKDFELLARFFNYERSVSTGETWDADQSRTKIIDGLARLLASELAKTNPRFDRERFVKACGQ